MKTKKRKTKRTKKRRQKKAATPKYLSMEEIVNQSADSSLKSFTAYQNQINKILIKYSLKDILLSLFISNIWLPNISGLITHQYLYLLTCSLKIDDFSTIDKINEYDDFRGLLECVHKHLPSFPLIEDYVPETDWGEIKYEYNGQFFKIFYGNELSNVYDYITLFEIIFSGYNDAFENKIHRSPLEELKFCLQLQDIIINNISHQKKIEMIDISPGHIEIPEKDFFYEAKDFFLNNRLADSFPSEVLKHYSAEFVKTDIKYNDFNSFIESFFSGDFLPWYFITYNGHHFPLLPRKIFPILFENWCKIFNQLNETILKTSDSQIKTIGPKIYGFIKNRVNTDSLFPIVSAINIDKKPHSLIFHCSLISKDKLVLIHLLPLAFSNKQIEKELEQEMNQMEESISLMSTQPVTLALHLYKQNVQFRSENKDRQLEPYPITIIPQVTTQITGIKIPERYPGQVMFLDGFLGIIDELDNIDDLSNFIDYQKEHIGLFGPLLSTLDVFGSFKDSNRVLIEGASEPTMISLDPHWGTSIRYRTLSEFWALYPEIGYFDEPRSWKVKKESPTRIRLEARAYLGATIYSKKLTKHFFFTSPFVSMQYDQGNLSNLLMECLEDSIEKRIEIIAKHAFFCQNKYNRIDFLFFPKSLVSNNDKFQHLSHLKTNGKIWVADASFIQSDLIGIRFVFDDDLLRSVLKNVKDSTLEADIVLETFTQINNLFPDHNFCLISQEIEITKSGQPRYILYPIKKIAAFPDFVSPCEPDVFHFKMVRKQIAKIAKLLNLKEGQYELYDAKKILNELNQKSIDALNEEIRKYNYTDSIPFLLTRIDALNHQHFRNQTQIEIGLTHHIDYDPDIRYAHQFSHYIRNHNNYRYLIEKFVQIEPKSELTISKDSFQYLSAFVDWILVFYSASDSLHYDINPQGMEVNHDFLVEIRTDPAIQEKEKLFAEENAKIDLGLLGNPKDKVQTILNTESVFQALNDAFYSDYQFKLSTLIAATQIMANWPYYKDSENENTFYSANIEEIASVCKNEIKGINIVEIPHIINFLTLDSKKLLLIKGSNTTCYDLPVWEHNKRLHRYIIRPVIRIGDHYYWAPYSIAKAGELWLTRTMAGSLPASIAGTSINKIINNQKTQIEKKLEDKAFQILSEQTKYIRKNLWLHKADKNGKHPSELGDFDVFTYFPEKKLIVIIECKDLLPPFCMKDAKRLREKIFGRPEIAEGYIDKALKRQLYIEGNHNKILQSLSWPVAETDYIRVTSIFVTRNDYWWTRYPPIETKLQFSRIDLLSHVLKNSIFKGLN